MNPHLNPRQIESTLERVLLEVERPARYIGGEYNSITKQWTAERLKVALCFPDIYDLGTPNLGLATLYQILNRHADLLAERVFLPWVDMEAVMQREGLPLYSLESKHPVQDFDMLGISLPYEQLYTNTLHLLRLSGMPLLARDRLAQHYPLPAVCWCWCFSGTSAGCPPLHPGRSKFFPWAQAGCRFRVGNAPTPGCPSRWPSAKLMRAGALARRYRKAARHTGPCHAVLRGAPAECQHHRKAGPSRMAAHQS